MGYRALVQKLGDRTNQNTQTSELILEHRTGHPNKLYTCLVILNGKPAKEYRSKYRTKTDAELSAELSQFPCWDETEHPNLSNVDYRQYKHKKSPRTIKAISKWL